MSTFRTLLDVRGGLFARNADGIQMNTSQLVVEGAIFASNRARGIRLFAQSANRTTLDLRRSTFFDNTHALETEHVLLAGGPIELTIRQTIFERNGRLIRTADQFFTPTWHTFWRNLYADVIGDPFSVIGSPPDIETSLRSSALLVDPEAGDFAPTERSPARLYALEDPGETMHADPLYVDLDGRDFALTRSSPARALSADGSHAGALPWFGAESPGLLGYLWEPRSRKPI